MVPKLVSSANASLRVPAAAVAALLLLGAALLAGFGASTSPSGGSASGSGDVGTQTLPAPVGTARYIGTATFEPTLGVTSDGTIFFGALSGGGVNIQLVRKSANSGLTWTDATPTVAGLKFPPNTNDPYVYVDADTDRVFVADLQALMCSTLSYSDDKGATWIPNPIGCGHPVGVHDHQTVFSAAPRLLVPVGYPKIVYYCVNRVADSACASSLNGGLSFGPLRPLIYQGVGGTNGALCSGLTGHGQSAPDGTIYLPAKRCSTGNSPPVVAISRDDGLTWQVVTIAAGHSVFDHDVAFNVDEAGNAYALWISSVDRKPYLAVSTNGGFNWGAPIQVAATGVLTTSFMEVAAGAAGRIAIIYYGTTNAPNNLGGAVWDAHLGVSVDAASATPTFQWTKAQTNIATGSCDGINRCNGVGDFIDLVIDAQGRPWGAFDDVTGNPSGGFAGTLSAGPALRGPLVALPPL